MGRNPETCPHNIINRDNPDELYCEDCGVVLTEVEAEYL